MEKSHELGPTRGQGLVDVLDRILDKGLVVAGDIRVRLADVELLTIQIRLLVCSVDKAEEIGLDWWKHKSFLTSRFDEEPAMLEMERTVERLVERVRELEAEGSKDGSERT